MGSIAFRVPMENVDRKEGLALLPLPDGATLQTLQQPASAKLLAGNAREVGELATPHIGWETGLEQPASLHRAAIPKAPST